MFLTSFWLALIGYTAFVAPADEAEAAARQRLTKMGAKFCLFSLHIVHLNERDDRPEDRIGFFVTIGQNWKGTPKDLLLLNNLRNLRCLSFCHPELCDDWCEGITPAMSLECLFFMGKGFTDKGLQRFRQLKNLQSLSLYDTSVTDKGLQSIEGFDKLRFLNIMNSRIGNEGMRSIGKLKNLEVLLLDHSKVGGVGFKHIADLSKLQEISICESEDGKSGLAFLSGVRSLKKIEAFGVEITVEDTSILAKSRSLKEVRFLCCNLRDSYLSNLADLPELTRLDLSGTPVSSKIGPALVKMKALKILHIESTMSPDVSRQLVSRGLLEDISP